MAMDEFLDSILPFKQKHAKEVKNNAKVYLLHLAFTFYKFLLFSFISNVNRHQLSCEYYCRFIEEAMNPLRFHL
jgi:hypothetical protein